MIQSLKGIAGYGIDLYSIVLKKRIDGWWKKGRIYLQQR
jgi:hypothetical protein